MRPFFLGLLFFLALLTGVGAAPRLRIGVEVADKPISFVDAARQPAGFTAELVAEMSRHGLGEVELVPAPWTILIKRFEAGELDVLANVARTDERLRTMDFSISHAYVHGVIYFRRDAPSITRTADLAGKKIGTLRGSISYTNALAHGGWGATIVPSTSPQLAIDAARRGELDGVLLIYGLEGKYLTDLQGMRRDFVDDILHEFRFAVPKGESATLSRLNDALATVRQNGTFDRLYDKWIGPIEPHPIRLADLRPYTGAIVLGVILIAAIIGWQRHMLARVSRHAAALRESEERFERLVDSAFEGWVIHRDGLIVRANPTFSTTFGFTATELVGRSVVELTAPESRAKLVDAIKTGRTTPYEVMGLRRDGTLIPVEIAGQPCTFDGQPARIAAVRDLTAQKQAAADQLVLSKLESTGILAGGIAHDFNNLLATMVLNVDLALLLQRNTPEGTRHLESVKDAATAAKNLTQQLITFAQGSAPLRQPTDLGILLNKIVPLTLSGSNVRGEVTLVPGLWCAEIDSDQIERVISNLVLNSREAMPAGGVVTLRAENATLPAGEVATLAAGDYLRITVADRGHGIPADLLSKIFDPYFSTKRRGSEKGMGLGLTISHAIAQQHGGALVVETQAALGTTFHLYLPATRRSPAPSALLASASPFPAARSDHILIMDDEPALRQTIRLALEQDGSTVAEAGDGAAAVTLYQQARASGRPFDVVLLDLTVRGGMGGLETIQALRALDPTVRAVVMSGYSRESVLRDYASHGFRGALAKPFDFAGLRRAISAASKNAV
jgi:two-component system cell cycle sensor histidine kinase/response regulator CckA